MSIDIVNGRSGLKRVKV